MNLPAFQDHGVPAGALRVVRPNPLAAGVLPPPVPQAQAWLSAYDGRCGAPVDLSQAVPDHAPPAAFLDHFAALGTQPQVARYGPILGDAALRAVYAEHVSKTYGAPVAGACVAITAGCNQAFFVAAMAIAAAGGSIILPTPWYFNQQMTLAMLGIEARALQTPAETGFVPEIDAVDALIDGTTRALVLVSPNNPTGAIYPPETIEALFDLCRRRGLFLILDETYRDFRGPGAGAPHALFERADWGDHLVSLYSFSKSFAIPGHRLGAMVAGPSILAAVENVLDCVQICAPRPSQAALALSMEETAGWRAKRTAEIHARGTAFRSAMAGLPAWPIAQLGAYFAYVRHPFADRSSVEVAAAMAGRLGLLTLPGSFFGPGQERYLRIAFANVDKAGIAAFAKRLAEAGDLFSPLSETTAGHG